MSAFKQVTRTYTDDNGEEVTVTGQDIEKFPDPAEHDFYQEGRFLKCNCHPHTSKRLPDNMNLVKEGGSFTFKATEVL